MGMWLIRLGWVGSVRSRVRHVGAAAPPAHAPLVNYIFKQSVVAQMDVTLSAGQFNICV